MSTVWSSSLLAILAVASADAPEEEQEDPNRLELGVIPALNFDSDLGFGFGAFGAAARYDPDYFPWRWRLEGLIFLTIKERPGGGVEVPFTQDYLQLDWPGLLDGLLRITVRGQFHRHRSRGWFGVGNLAMVDEAQVEVDPRFHRYDRIYPSLDVALRIDAGSDLELVLDLRYTHNWINVSADSLLAVDAPRLAGTGRHGEVSGTMGVLFDSRDSETSPSRGQLHEISVRAGIGVEERFAYTGVDLTLRGFLPIFDRYIVFAGRLLGDVLSGSVPFYELARHGGLAPQDTTGGAQSIRGVAAQRFHGKVKVLTNVELRFEAPGFSILGQQIHVGGLGFFDAGRVWSSFAAPAEIDGQKLGLAIGSGGGLRLRWGETFVLRGDVAWSPTEESLGIYVDINHVF